MASKYERELEELLAGLGAWTPQETRAQRLRRRFRVWLSRWQATVAQIRWGGISTEPMMLAGIALIVFAYVLRLASPLGAAYVGLLGVLLFFVAFALAIKGARRSRNVRWRGRPVEPYHRGNFLLAWLRSWWQRRTWR